MLNSAQSNPPIQTKTLTLAVYNNIMCILCKECAIL